MPIDTNDMKQNLLRKFDKKTKKYNILSTYIYAINDKFVDAIGKY